MDPLIVGLIGIAILIILLFSGLSIGMGMALVGFVGFAVIVGIGPALGLLKTVPYNTFAHYDLSVIPLFILMGSFALAAGMSEDLFNAVYKWVGHWRGGVAQATIVACACFAAVSGSSLATAATLGAVALPEMRKYKYDDALADRRYCRRGKYRDTDPSERHPYHLRHHYRAVHREALSRRIYPRDYGDGFLHLHHMVSHLISNLIMAREVPKTTFQGKNRCPLKIPGRLSILFIVVIGGIYRGVVYSHRSRRESVLSGPFSLRLFKRRLNWQKCLKSSLDKYDKGHRGMLFFDYIGGHDIRLFPLGDPEFRRSLIWQAWWVISLSIDI